MALAPPGLGLSILVRQGLANRGSCMRLHRFRPRLRLAPNSHCWGAARGSRMGSKTDPFRGPIRTMATLKCLACGHDNNVGDESCSSCSSSLNLKLCSACEAINANEADRCHSCNADFRMEPEVVTSELDTPSLRQPVAEEASAGKALPTVWRLATDQARRPSTRSAAALAVLPLLAVGAAYYFYASPQAPTQPPAVPKEEAAQKA